MHTHDRETFSEPFCHIQCNSITSRTSMAAHIVKFCIIAASARISGNYPGMTKWAFHQLHDVLNAYPQIAQNVVIVDPHTRPYPVHHVVDAALPISVRDSSGYLNAETRDWSEFVRSCDAVVVVTPEYNAGYPSTLKNALDVLYWEWNQKPTAVVTYGSHGGSKVDDQIRQVMNAFKMDVVAQRVQVTLPENYISSEQRVQCEPHQCDGFLLPYKDTLNGAFRQLIEKVQLRISKSGSA